MAKENKKIQNPSAVFHEQKLTFQFNWPVRFHTYDQNLYNTYINKDDLIEIWWTQDKLAPNLCQQENISNCQVYFKWTQYLILNQKFNVQHSNKQANLSILLHFYENIKIYINLFWILISRHPFWCTYYYIILKNSKQALQHDIQTFLPWKRGYNKPQVKDIKMGSYPNS